MDCKFLRTSVIVSSPSREVRTSEHVDKAAKVVALGYTVPFAVGIILITLSGMVIVRLIH